GSLGIERAPHDRGLLQGVRQSSPRGGVDRPGRERRAVDQGDAELMSTRIAILDYGMGNLRSVEKALARVGGEAEITSDPKRAESADGLILPGVGAFPKAMGRVREIGLDQLVESRLEAGVPVLGICLGLQLLFDSSVENEGASGLALLGGLVSP